VPKNIILSEWWVFAANKGASIYNYFIIIDYFLIVNRKRKILRASAKQSDTGLSCIRLFDCKRIPPAMPVVQKS